MNRLKFQNVHGREGSFTTNKRKYSFFNGTFEVNEDDENLVKFFKGSTSWIAYIPTAEDKVKESKKEIAKLKEEIKSLKTSKDGKVIKGLREEIEALDKIARRQQELLDEAGKRIEAFKAEKEQNAVAQKNNN